jgi:hypothetical protein
LMADQYRALVPSHIETAFRGILTAFAPWDASRVRYL